MTRRIATIIALLAVVLFCAPQSGLAQSQGLPACAATGDKDGDGVSDEADSDEADSCTASTSGLEDCATGAGDGLPDCE